MKRKIVRPKSAVNLVEKAFDQDKTVMYDHYIQKPLDSKNKLDLIEIFAVLCGCSGLVMLGICLSHILKLA